MRNEDLANDMIGIEEWTDSMQSMTGHLKNAATRNLRKVFFKGQGQKRLQPCDSWRQLEQ